MKTDKTFQFPHQRLDAWHLSREARRLTLQLLDTLPRGYSDRASPQPVVDEDDEVDEEVWLVAWSLQIRFGSAAWALCAPRC